MDWSSVGKWSLFCFIYSDFMKYASFECFVHLHGLFLAVLFVFLAMNE